MEELKVCDSSHAVGRSYPAPSKDTCARALACAHLVCASFIQRVRGSITNTPQSCKESDNVHRP